MNNTIQSITKPIIIVDGIDYEGVRKEENIYEVYLCYIDGNNAEQNLGAELCDAGYDIVILDFPNVEATR